MIDVAARRYGYKLRTMRRPSVEQHGYEGNGVSVKQADTARLLVEEVCAMLGGKRDVMQ